MPDAESVVLTDALAPFRELETEAIAQVGMKTDGATPEEAAAFWRELAAEGTVPLEELLAGQDADRK